MDERQPQLDRWSFRILLAAVGSAAAALFLTGPWQWYLPSVAETGFWNGIIAFTILGIVADSSFLPVPRISGARLGSSVNFVPFLASVMLFEPPWPMLIALVTGSISQLVVRRKSLVRASFNTAQYMLAVGLGGLVYAALGGHVGFDKIELNFVAFAALVLLFFIVNHLTVSLAVSVTTDISPVEVWMRIARGFVLYDLVSSSLAIVLAYLFVEFRVVGLAALVLPLFFVRHMYQMNLQVERVNRELLELMVKAIEARDPYTSGHSRRVSRNSRLIAEAIGLRDKQAERVAV